MRNRLRNIDGETVGIWAVMAALVALLVFCFWSLNASSKAEMVEFFDACKGVGKSDAECRYEWAKAKNSNQTTVVPMPVVVSGGR